MRPLPDIAALAPKPTNRLLDFTQYTRRMEFVKTYAWSIPCEEAITTMQTFCKNLFVLEVGAGLGLWAAYLKAAGVNIQATDAFVKGQRPKKTNSYCAYLPTFTYIHQFEAEEAVKVFKPEVLFFNWPCYQENYAIRSLKAFKGDRLVYIGEGNGGCTADDAFHAELEHNWEEVNEVDIPQWHYIHDRMHFFKRKA